MSTEIARKLPLRLSDELVQGDLWEWGPFTILDEDGAPVDTSTVTINAIGRMVKSPTTSFPVEVAEAVDTTAGVVVLRTTPSQSQSAQTGTWAVEMEVASEPGDTPAVRRTVVNINLSVLAQVV